MAQATSHMAQQVDVQTWLMTKSDSNNKQTKQENKHTTIKEHSPKKQQKCKAVMGKQVAKI